MESENKGSNSKIILLKQSRLQILKLHKLLIDLEREKFEQFNGQVSSGQFLNLLVNDRNFEWLRVFSTLIVEIDEMADLDDGFSEDMIEKHLSRMRNIIGFKLTDLNFNNKFKDSLKNSPRVVEEYNNLNNLLAQK